MLVRNRLRVALLALATVGLAALFVTHFWFAAPGHQVVRTTGSSPQSASASSMSVLPGYEQLSPAQMLDRSMSLPGMHGIVRGVVGRGTVTQLSDGETVTDFALTITDARPTAGPPERVGAKLTLRVFGGCMPAAGRTLCAGSPDAPQVATGDDVFVFVRDQGSQLGGNTNSRLVASSSADVLTVRGGLVQGQGEWAGYSEPVDSFLRHFTR
jgi:hypothetical protein